MSAGPDSSRRLKPWRRFDHAAGGSFDAEVLEPRVLLSGYTLTTLATLTGNHVLSSGVVADPAGNLYGTTGGMIAFGGAGIIEGTVFKIAAGSQVMSTLASFDEAGDNSPGDLIIDSAGDLYGTTSGGNLTEGPGPFPSPTVFELVGGTTLLTLFSGVGTPYGLVVDGDGDLYGSTVSPGVIETTAVVELAAGTHTLSTLTINLPGSPSGNLALDAAGNLYGVTSVGGTDSDGSVFEVAAGTDAQSILVDFNGANGADPVGGLVVDAEGDLFGTTQTGGTNGDGTVFEIAAGTHVLSTLVNFNGTNGSGPESTLIIDAAGNLYGTTQFGGVGADSEATSGDGTVFEVAAGSNTLTTLVWFNGINGRSPTDGLSADAAGNLYGTTDLDGGTIFKLSPNTSAPAQVAFIQQPTSVLVGNAIGTPITVAVEDSGGNVITSDNSTVTLNISSGPAGTTLGGTLTANVVNGLATFTGISLDATGNFTLGASDGSLTNGTSTAFVVAPTAWVDTADMNEITGWAVDPSNPTASINVEVDITGGPAQTFSADESRPDLQAFVGSANHGFTYATPVLSVGSHAAYIYAIETNGDKVLLATKTLVSQNSLFDEHYYLKMNPDVAAAVAAGQFATGYDHYVEYGQYEGRSPSPYWDEAWYLQENPDVAAAVKAGTVSSGFMQYYQYGQFENRGGLLYFNNSYYLQNNRDVAAAITAGTITSAFEHFVIYGQYEGRSPMPYFSSSVYDAHNPDILDFVTGETLSSNFEQFILYGQYEGRIASNFYNEQTYLADNPDVAAAVRAGDYPDGFQQWLEYGQFEGRTAV